MSTHTADAHSPQVKIWNRNFTLAFAVNFFIAIVFYTLMTSMALYAVDRFQASDAVAGFAASAFVLGSVVFRPPAGALLDIIGRRRMVIAAMIGFILISMAYIPTGQLWLLLALRLVHGMAFGAANTALNTAIQGLIPPKRRSEGTGFFGLSMTLAAAVGPLLATVFGTQGLYAAIFWWCAGFSVVGLLGALLMRLPEQPADASKRDGWWKIPPSSLIDRATLPIGMVMFLAAIAYSGVLAFLTSYARQFDVVSATSMFFILYAAATLVSRFWLGRIQDTIGDNAVVYPCLALFTIAMLLLAIWPTSWSVLVSGVLAGVGFGGIIPSTQTIAVHLSNRHRIGIAMSTFFLLFDFGNGVGPVILGLILPLTGFRGMYLAMAVLVVITGIYYAFCHGRKGGRRGARA